MECGVTARSARSIKENPARQRLILSEIQCRDPGQPLRQPLPRQHSAGFVFEVKVVMGLSPVIAGEAPRLLTHSSINTARATEQTCIRGDTS
jgi:hypothetical protein